MLYPAELRAQKYFKTIYNTKLIFKKEFFTKMKSMDGVRLPGERRHKNRLNKGPREINTELVNKIKSLSK